MKNSKTVLSFLSVTLIAFVLAGCPSSNERQACYTYVSQYNSCVGAEDALDDSLICDTDHPSSYLSMLTEEQRLCALDYYDCISDFFDCNKGDPVIKGDCDPCLGVNIDGLSFILEPDFDAIEVDESSTESDEETEDEISTGQDMTCSEVVEITECPLQQCSTYKCDDGFIIGSINSICADTGLPPTQCAVFDCPSDAPSVCLSSACSEATVEIITSSCGQ